MFCTNCGKKLHDGDRFCGNCGTRVREEEAPKRQEIVFNPPFRVEAERRTADIFRGFAEEKAEEPKQPRRTEPVAFDWNLDGFPTASPRKTEEVDFNWDSVIDRKNSHKKEDTRSVPAVPVVDKIDIRAAQEPEKELEGESKKVPEAVPERNAEAVSEKAPEFVTETAAEPVPGPAETAESFSVTEAAPAGTEIPESTASGSTASESTALERELFGADYRSSDSMGQEEKAKNTMQLEKFYTFNEKKEAFQELLDKEYERLRTMEEERKPDTESLEFTWAGTLFPSRNVSEGQPAEHKPEEMTEEATEEVTEEVTEENAPAAEGVPADTIDFTPIRQEARLRSQMDRANDAGETAEKACAEGSSGETWKPTWAVDQTPEADADADKKTETENPATPSSGEENSMGEKERLRLRYSDIFPREDISPDSDADGDSASVDASPSCAAFLPEQGEDEDEEPEGMNPLIKLIIGVLVLLIIAEGAILAAKFIAPDSAFSVKTSQFTGMILDKLTGGGDQQQDAADQAQAASSDVGDLPEETYISSILREKIEQPDTIGRVLEDTELKYDSEKTYAFGDAMASSTAFVDEIWRTGEDGQTVTKAAGILGAVTSYFDQWKATNTDASLIGINKLEIGEIRTGDEGYYVLCRITFAGANGEDVVKYVTAYVKDSQDSMIINETKEETF